MASALVLVDTSYWIDALRTNGDKTKRSVFEQLLLAGRVAWTEPVKLELWNGTKNQKELKVLEEFDSCIPTLETTKEVWELSFKIGSFLRRKGLTVPCVDILIISVSAFYEVELLHSDKHFGMILNMLPR